MEAMDRQPLQRRLVAIFLSSCFLTPFLAFAEKIAGQVGGVLNGDAIEVLHNNRPERIRLNGIDYSEKGQAYARDTSGS